MHIFLSKSFGREADRIGISDGDCKESVAKAERGLIDASLGSGLIKQRIPVGARGASKGARAIIYFRRGDLSVFPHAFTKGEKSNLSRSELAQYLDAAKALAPISETDLHAMAPQKGWRRLEP